MEQRNISEKDIDAALNGEEISLDNGSTLRVGEVGDRHPSVVGDDITDYTVFNMTHKELVRYKRKHGAK